MRRMAPVRPCLSIFVVCLCSFLLPALSAQDLPNKKALVGQARDSYYNLRSQGLSSFECSITPNWQLLLQDQRKQDPAATDTAIQTLNQLRFVTTLAADDSVKLTHNDLPGQSEQMMAALKQIFGGMEQMTSGFFDTWKLFMVSRPFPDVDSQYLMESLGQQYRLSYKDGNADVVTTMARDFSISDLKVTTPDFNSSLQPTFTRTPRGWRLSGYEASYQSQKPEEATHLKVFVDYQDVQGLSVLQKLSLSGSYGGAPFAIELAFSACRVTKN
ncbi:MAG TPA: hypothetical protein VKW06_19550 [Candidatus Angelobacter sp.]|nr:hypothetical protein [Candidatus Angelobacter sp.]